MDLSKDEVDEKFWHDHIVRVKNYSGSFAAYCRLHNLDYDKFMYYRGKSVSSSAAPVKQSGFTKVHATNSTAKLIQTPIEKPRSYPQLPSAQWLSELIHNLMSAQR